MFVRIVTIWILSTHFKTSSMSVEQKLITS